MLPAVDASFDDSTHTMIAAGWNMRPDVLDTVEYRRMLGTRIMVPPMHTCRSPTSNSIIDYSLMGPRLARLMSSVRVDTSWVIKPHRPVSLEIRPDALRIKQL
eukprot:7615776-Pyramimonas_sp.AAC.1